MDIYLDIETTSLDADHGPVIAIGILKGDRPEVRFIESPGGERGLLEWLKAELDDGGTVITWYGSGFDVPFLLTRAALLGVDLTPLARAPKLDLCEWSKEHLKLSKYGLESVARFFGLQRKMEFRGSDVPTLHKLARRGDEKAKSMIVQHCEDDIQLLKSVHEKVKLYIEHP